mgnify:CR=1 FL=1
MIAIGGTDDTLKYVLDKVNVKVNINAYTQVPEGQTTVHQGWSGDVIAGEAAQLPTFEGDVGTDFRTFIVPVGLLQGAGFTGAATGVNLARDIEQGWFDRLLVGPSSRPVLLTGIVGSLDLLQTRLNQGRTDRAGRYIEAAMTSANRAAALTHRLLEAESVPAVMATHGWC